MKKLLLGTVALGLLSTPHTSNAQATRAPIARVVASCGTPPSGYTANALVELTIDTTGTLCTAGGGGGGGGGGGPSTQGTVPWADNITQWGGTSVSIGQQLMAASVPVTLASNQSALTVNLGTIGTAATAANQSTEITSLASIATNTTGAATAGNQTTANTSLASIATNTTGAATAANQTTANTSLGTIATNTTGAATAANQTTANTSLASIATNTTGASTAANQSTANTSLASIATNTTGVATAANQSTANTSLASIATNTTGLSTAANQSTANTSLGTIDTDIKATEPRTVFKGANAALSPSVCLSSVTVTPSTATDTLAVEISGSKDIYVCDTSASSNGANNFYLESASSTSCGGSLVQMGNTFYTAQYWLKTAPNAYYRGVHTGASLGLCVHTTAAQALSVTIYYDQY